MTRKPDFMIIGAMKCATSTLHDQLAVQEGVVMSMPKEPNFFSDEENWGRGLSWYWSLFARAEDGELCGESSTHYTKLPRHPKVIERVAEHVPDAKFIYVMRNPLDRLVSHYMHEWTQRVLTVSLAKAIDDHPALIQFGQYAMQLEPYFEAFGKERVLPVFFDRLRTHSQEELERVCKFIGYGGDPKWKSDMGAKNVSGDRMRKSKLRDMLVYAPGISQVRQMVPQGVRDRIKKLWTMNKRPELTEGQRRRLEAVFNPDLAKLGGWLGVPELTCANFKEVTKDRALDWV